jgi:hypothetical protein
MAGINPITGVLHRIRVKLYPDYLSHVEGAYIACTDNEASLSIEEVYTALKNRGGFTGNYDDLAKHVKQFLDEMICQLCDGFAVNTGYFLMYPNVGGTFDKVVEGHDTEKHPVTFRFRTLAALRALAGHIVVDVEGLAENAANRLIGIVLALGAGNWQVEVKTRFSGSGSTVLKVPRTITSAFTLTIPVPAP